MSCVFKLFLGFLSQMGLLEGDSVILSQPQSVILSQPQSVSNYEVLCVLLCGTLYLFYMLSH